MAMGHVVNQLALKWQQEQMAAASAHLAQFAPVEVAEEEPAVDDDDDEDDDAPAGAAGAGAEEDAEMGEGGDDAAAGDVAGDK